MSYYDYVESTCKVRVKPSHLPNKYENWKTLYIWNMDPEFVWKKPKLEELRPLESCKEEFKKRWNEFYQNPSGYDVVLERNRIEWVIPPRTAKIYPTIPEGKELDENSGEGIVQFCNSTTFEADLDEINTWIQNSSTPITIKHVIYNWIMSFWK